MTFPYDQGRLQALFDEVDARLESTSQVAAQATQYQPRSRGVTAQDLAEIERYARSGNAPKEFKDLQQRIDSGEFSWQDIASGRVMDDGVQKALATGVPDLQRAYTAIEEGQDIDDIIASGNPAPRPPRPSRADDEDDDGPSHFRRDAW